MKGSSNGLMLTHLTFWWNTYPELLRIYFKISKEQIFLGEKKLRLFKSNVKK